MYVFIEPMGVSLTNNRILLQIDLRQESTIRFAAPSAYPVITFGPFDTPAQVVASLSHAIGISFLITSLPVLMSSVHTLEMLKT